MWLVDAKLISKGPCIVLTDSEACVTGVADGKISSPREAVRQAGRLVSYEIEHNRVQVWHVSGEENCSDLFTKSQTGEVHEHFAQQLCGIIKLDVPSAGKGVKAVRRDFL